MKLNDKLYDVLKWVALLLLPASATLIGALGTIWGWGDLAKNIALTITAFDVFLGAILGISTVTYNKANNATDNNEGAE